MQPLAWNWKLTDSESNLLQKLIIVMDTINIFQYKMVEA